ncbi:hypothetical protein B0J11DRAFT_34395 [Dendryphion nanum]|uniref:BRCT domain-containing protein n=1 Tax=Dendryphion nanum TaxID=256645 RepID=A0A9P9EIX9_9PLEO|nr:hypothetical protein B0J11DRAFT_34395 [Dendryphion nanum]
MGASIKLDLTSDVTHLIAGNVESAKYRYVAKSRQDVRVLAPEWLEALRKEWMSGDDNVDVRSLEEQYRLPIFHGLKICLTGFDNPDQRKYIQETVTQHGAEYHGDLTKSVTHLIAATPTGKKYEHAVSWRMNIVTWEWLQQSCQRGMALDERYFHPTMDIEDRGKGALDRKRESPPPLLGKRTRDVEQPLQAINPLKRQLRRSASSKMGSQSEALWAGITAVGLERKANEDDDWTEENAHDIRLSRAPSPRSPSNDPAAAHGRETHPQDPASDTRALFLASRTQDGIFEGRVVFPYGFDAEKTNILRDHIGNNGAAMLQSSEEIHQLSSDDLRQAFLVIPHDAVIDLTSLPGGAGNMSLVTNWWVERCLHSKSLIDPSESILCTPFNKLRINGFTDLIVNATGFAGIELLQVTKVITLMGTISPSVLYSFANHWSGATYDEYLTDKTSVIVCKSRTPSPAKLKFATANKVTAVHATWLWDCVQSGDLQPYDKYLVNKIDHGQSNKHHQKADRPYTEIPTAPLSEEDSFKLRKRKTHAGKPQAKPNARGFSHQAGTLDLTLSTAPSPFSAKDTSVSHFDGPALLPLQDISPGVNSPRRQSTSSNGSNAKSASSRSTTDVIRKPAPLPREIRQPTPDSVIPPLLDLEATPAPAMQEPEERNASIVMSELLARRKQAKSCPTTGRKPRRQLGRAASSRSATSTADDPHSRASSVAIEDREKQAIEIEPPRRPAMGFGEYQPSQELGWEVPGAQEARERMIRAFGGTVQDEGVKVGSIGMVKDVVGGVEMSAGGGARDQRAGRRRRG